MGQCTECKKRFSCQLKKDCEEQTGFEVQVCRYYEKENARKSSREPASYIEYLNQERSNAVYPVEKGVERT